MRKEIVLDKIRDNKKNIITRFRWKWEENKPILEEKLRKYKICGERRETIEPIEQNKYGKMKEITQ